MVDLWLMRVVGIVCVGGGIGLRWYGTAAIGLLLWLDAWLVGWWDRD